VSERVPGGGGELGAGGRQAHSRGSQQQRRSNPLLQLPDLLAQRGLRDVQASRGAREAQILGQRDEVAQVPKLDVVSHKAFL